MSKVIGAQKKAPPAPISRPPNTEIKRQNAIATRPTAVFSNTPAPLDEIRHRLLACKSCSHNCSSVCSLKQLLNVPSEVTMSSLSQRSNDCPAWKWHPCNDSFQPLEKPVKNLLFHMYPKLGAEWNWYWHIAQIRKHLSLFNGKICIGVATGEGLASATEVKEAFKGIPVTDWIIRPNSKGLGETTTLKDLLQCVETSDPNVITFRGHCKGVTHTKEGCEQPWARLMWETCMDWPSVAAALSSHLMAGAMKCHEPLVSKQKYKWFYAGTFFWFRNKEIFSREWATMEQTRWYPEAWPGVLCTNQEAACLCHDFTDGSVLSNHYWKTQVQSDFTYWLSARPNLVLPGIPQ